MTVKELIEKLQQMPPDAEAYVDIPASDHRHGEARAPYVELESPTSVRL